MEDNTFTTGVITSIVGSLIFFSLGMSYSWMRRNIYFIKITRRKIKLLITRKKYILIWNDHSEDTSKRITTELKKTHKKFLYREIDEPRDLLYFPSGYKYVKLIILIDTDVTKFSEIPIEREKIQLKLKEHINRGGSLFGTHDIIYRRVRNELLQKLYGCQLNNFKRENSPIEAIVATEHSNHPLLNGISEPLQFDDGEVCWGKWAPSSLTLIMTKKGFNKRKSVPLLVVRKGVNNGFLIWMNSGDKFVGLCKSIGEPQEKFIKIIRNALTYGKEIRDY